MTSTENNKNENINIDVKFYDGGSFGIRVFDESKGFGDINDLVANAEVNGDHKKEMNVQELAIAEALSKLVEKHEAELIALYHEEIKKHQEGYYD